MRDYEAEAGQWAIGRLGDARRGAPPGAEDAYAICGVMAALVGDGLREGAPDARLLIELRPRRARFRART